MLRLLRQFFDPLARSVEATAWLRANRNESALATNRFTTSQNALRYVESLYAAGAELVAIPKSQLFRERWRVKGEGGAYCETLLVKLPIDPEARSTVWRLCRNEILEQGVEKPPPVEPPKDDLVWLWWD